MVTSRGWRSAHPQKVQLEFWTAYENIDLGITSCGADEEEADSHLWRKLCLFLRGSRDHGVLLRVPAGLLPRGFSVPPNSLWEACPWNHSTYSKQESLGISSLRKLTSSRFSFQSSDFQGFSWLVVVGAWLGESQESCWQQNGKCLLKTFFFSPIFLACPHEHMPWPIPETVA